MIVAKLSSKRTRSAASLATSVPLIPIAIPISACSNAGASFTPSPVIATICPLPCNKATMRILSAGCARAISISRSKACDSSVSDRTASSSWVITVSGCRPIALAMACAVTGLSPVIIMIRMPAACANAIAAGTSGRGGSMIPTSPKNTKASSFSVSPDAGDAARAITRCPFAAMSE